MERGKWNRLQSLAAVLLSLTLLMLRPGPAVGQIGLLGLGETATLTDGTRVTVWEGFAADVKAPDADTYIYAVRVSICTEDSPSDDNRRAWAEHFDLIVPPMRSGQLVTGLVGGAFEDRKIGPNECNEGWVTYVVDRRLRPYAINYHERVCDPADVELPLPAGCLTPPEGLWLLP